MSHAVVLRSLDGGRSWQAVPAPSLPRLAGLRVQENRCLAWGDYSPLWRTSLFESLDGGQSWRGLQFPRGNSGDDNAAVPMGHATAAELSSHGDVGAVDVLGRIFSWFECSRCESQSADDRQPTQPLLAAAPTGSNWLACGSQGELISSRDGAQWTNVVVPLSPAARQLCQWRITQIEDTVWVCGYPGSILLTSPDRGATWQVKKTGQTLPLSAMHFVDQSRGWATGPLGLMLATRDAGQTWYAQRQRARRLGVLAISNTALDIPWAPLAAAAGRTSCGCRYRGSVDRSNEQADFLPSRWATYHDLAPQIGLAGLFSQSLTENSSTNFSDKMVLQLRCWRPDVVILADGKNQPVGQQRQLRPSLEGELLTAMKNGGRLMRLRATDSIFPLGVRPNSFPLARRAEPVQRTELATAANARYLYLGLSTPTPSRRSPYYRKQPGDHNHADGLDAKPGQVRIFDGAGCSPFHH
ncbi:MAG: YCF48-related protein [Pirellulaceae bacterium]